METSVGKKWSLTQDSQENIQIREYYESLKPTSNGDVIVNPTFSQNPDGSMNINAQVGKYQTYHAVNGLRNGLGVTQINLSENIPYKVLSAGVVMFHKGTNTFYLFKRPIDSQEAPGEVDILGGCLNVTDGMEDGIIFPDRFVTSRMQKKAGLSVDPNHLNCLGVQEFQKRGFYNIVYLYELSDEQIPHLLRKGALLPISYKEAMVVKNQDGPGGAGLSLAINYLQK